MQKERNDDDCNISETQNKKMREKKQKAILWKDKEICRCKSSKTCMKTVCWKL